MTAGCNLESARARFAQGLMKAGLAPGSRIASVTFIASCALGQTNLVRLVSTPNSSRYWKIGGLHVDWVGLPGLPMLAELSCENCVNREELGTGSGGAVSDVRAQFLASVWPGVRTSY